jgi:2-amino-4-hydroxy-6-hydroxymethyldihydropteridine diphosphokinase
MSFLIATGSNLGDRQQNLVLALGQLQKKFTLIKTSHIYESKAVDYEKQPDFLNQVIEFKIPKVAPQQALEQCLKIEKELGRLRGIDKGPRTVDIDILFWGLSSVDEKTLTIPHPRLFERSFIVFPLKELPYFKTLEKHYPFPSTFNNQAHIYHPKFV